MKDVIISNPERLKQIKQNIKKDGFEKLHVVSDFDKTLTRCFVDGKKIESFIAVLRDEHYLTPDYSEKAQALYDKYHPTEIDINLDLEEKNRLMREWWRLHYDLLIKAGLTKADLKKAVSSDKISLRQGAKIFFSFLHNYKIPLVILSAAGVGSETISLYLDKHNNLYDNVEIISNEFIWNEDGKAIGVKEPIIHSLNKRYSAIKDLLFLDKIKNRKNIILLGDGISDSKMVEGFNFDNVIKIGFLNENMKDKLVDYKNNYDVIILNDGPMDFVNELLSELIVKK